MTHTLSSGDVGEDCIARDAISFEIICKKVFGAVRHNQYCLLKLSASFYVGD